MSTSIPLPGLDRLIATCQRHSLVLELPPPLASAPQPGSLVLGEPVDAQLAAVYQRFGAASFGPLSLLHPGSDRMDLIPWNERLRELNDVSFLASFVFGQKTGFSLYYATVPRLADPRGLQPVVYITAHGASLYASPIASSVDRFFDLYSRYLELMVVDPDYIESGVSMITFPWEVPDLILRDEPLMAQVHAGRFDFLANDTDDGRGWLEELRAGR